MSIEEDKLKSLYADVAIKLFPPLLRDEIWSDSEFVSSLELSTDAMLSLREEDGVFKRSVFYGSIRKLLSDIYNVVEISDNENKLWHLYLSDKGVIELRNDESIYCLPGFSFFSPSSRERVDSLLANAKRNNLSPETTSFWEKILTERALLDYEVDRYEKDTTNTPLDCAEKVRSEINSGSSNISTLCPGSIKYFTGLIGISNKTTTFDEYLKNDLRSHIESLMQWRGVEGLYWAFILCAHDSVSIVLSDYVASLPPNDLDNLYKMIERDGDIISRIGAVEVGLTILDDRPKIKDFIEPLVRGLLDKEALNKRKPYELLSALFVLVDGENCQNNTFPGISPSLRRLASFSQASLLARQMMEANVDAENFSTWVFSTRSQTYYLNNLIDLRSEPRWMPESIAPEQLRHEFIGRLDNAASMISKETCPSALYELLRGEVDGGLVDQVEFIYSAMPGPLEGRDDKGPIPPIEILEMVNKQLGSDKVSTKSFISLVNSCLIYRLDASFSERAAKILGENRSRLDLSENGEEFIKVLNGLASVAAISRSVSLADELRILIRVYRRESSNNISVSDLARLGMIICAATPDFQTWCEYLGQWFTELSFEDILYEEAVILESYVSQLCSFVPELWTTLGSPRAALKSRISLGEK